MIQPGMDVACIAGGQWVRRARWLGIGIARKANGPAKGDVCRVVWSGFIEGERAICLREWPAQSYEACYFRPVVKDTQRSSVMFALWLKARLGVRKPVEA